MHGAVGQMKNYSNSGEKIKRQILTNQFINREKSKINDQGKIISSWLHFILEFSSYSRGTACVAVAEVMEI